MPADGIDGWSHRIRQNAFRYLFISSIILFALLAATFTQAHGSEWGDVPAIKGLHFSKVAIQPIIAVQTSHSREDSTYLTSHLLARLAEHKLVGILPERKDPTPLKNPLLTVTLLAREISGCPDKLLYVRNLELRELAVREREPKVYTDGVSFGGGRPDLFPEIIDVSAATRERFEKDLDWMVDRFAQHYWEWNGKSDSSQ
jgi:hypothetical protein